MQLSIVSGVTSNESAEFELTYPVNLEPIIINSRISRGQLRTAAGARTIGSGPGKDRGGIEWNGICYRVMGTKLVTATPAGAVTVLGDVGGSGPVSLDYSFDKLIIRSDRKLFYWDGTALTQIVDQDLGPCIDAIWIDGYTMSTDGTAVVVTELNDPYEVKPAKYGSSEADPDPITGLIKLRGEAYVLNRNTIQVLGNQGGTGFPFVTIRGATITTGCVSASAKTLFGNSFAFVGSGRGDALGVYVAGQGTANKISTRSVDDALAAEQDPTAIICERRVSRDELRLLVHLAAETWVFLARATEAAGEPIWYRCQSGTGGPYRLRNAVEVNGNTIVGDCSSASLGLIDHGISAHFGEQVQWQFDAGFIYNEARGAIIDRVELVSLSGRGDESGGSAAFMSITRDGRSFTQERAVSLGKLGERTKRIEWRPHFRMRNYAAFRFRGFSKALAGFAACEVQARPLSV